MDMEILTEHFSLEELSRTSQKFPNVPPAECINRLRTLCVEVLEPVRRLYGPLIITSGFRSEAVNKAVGGAKGSQHTKGMAADFVLQSTAASLGDAFVWMAHNLNFDQLIWEKGDNVNPSWIHVSYNSFAKNRQQILRIRFGGECEVINPKFIK